MRVSTIVVSYNVRDPLLGCLGSLEEIPDSEVIVVDNDSSDGSVAAVRSQFPRVQIVEMGSNAGFAAAVNAGVRLSKGDNILLLNPDTLLPQDALSGMLKALDFDPDAGAIGFRQTDEHGQFQLAFGWRPGWVGESFRKQVQHSIDSGGGPLARWVDGRAQVRRAVTWVSGSVLLVRRSAFDAVGGFDEEFFLYFEDIDFCLRLNAAGFRIDYDPAITVIHLRGASAKKASEIVERAYRASQLYFWRKHNGALSAGLMRMYLSLRGRLPATEERS